MTKPKRTVGFSPYGNFNGAYNIFPFEPLFSSKKNIIDGLKGIDCLLLWGGTDIHPSYYGDEHHKESGAPPLPSDRDVLEWNAMKWCLAHDIPMIGVCRGAQFGCAFSGGTLAQHVHGHGYEHTIETDDGRRITTTSSHHQMMNPYITQHKLIAWADPPRGVLYPNGKGDQITQMAMRMEAEIVYFPHTRFLAIQGHPEYGTATREFQDYCIELCNKYLFS